MFEGEDYGEKMIEGEVKLIQENLQKIINNSFKKNTTYVDLGPGFAEKSELILKEARKNKLNLSYIAIDIQEKYLEIASKKIKDLDIPNKKIKSSFFEGLPKVKEINNKFLYLGSTYCNFKVNEINSLLSENMLEEDYVYLSSELITQDIKEIIKEYETKEILKIITPIARKNNLDINKSNFKVIFDKDSSEIQAGFEIVENHGDFQREDFVILLKSRKATIESFKQNVEEKFIGDFFSNELFISFIGKVNQQ